MIANAVPKSPESPTGIRKAAMLLVLMGDKSSAEIIKQLSEDEVQLVSREIARLEVIPANNAEELLEEFYQMNMAHDLVVRGGHGLRKENAATRPSAPKSRKSFSIVFPSRWAANMPVWIFCRRSTRSSFPSSYTTSIRRRLRWSSPT